MLNQNQNQNQKIIETLNNFSFPNNNVFFLHTDLTNYYPDQIIG